MFCPKCHNWYNESMKYAAPAAGIAMAPDLPRPQGAVCAAADGPAPRGSQFSVPRGLPRPSRRWGAWQGLCSQHRGSAERIRVSPAAPFLTTATGVSPEQHRDWFSPSFQAGGDLPALRWDFSQDFGARLLLFLEVAPSVLNQSSGVRVLSKPAPGFSCCLSSEPPSPSQNCLQERAGGQETQPSLLVPLASVPPLGLYHGKLICCWVTFGHPDTFMA